MKEEPPEQQEDSEPPPHIKEEEEEEEEPNTKEFTFTPVPVKSEDEEEKPQSSQFHHTQRQHTETEPEPGPGSEMEVKMEDSSEVETEDSDEWEESRGSEFGETPEDETLKLFSCSHCGRRFNNKGKLTRHMMVHTVEKPFICPECGKGFTQKSNLTLHLAQHGEKPYSCSDCGETFPNYSMLATHARIHRGLKRFICSACGKEWRSSSKLKSHMRVHVAERPHYGGCTQCGTRFSSLFQVSSHRCVREADDHEETGPQSRDEGEETNASVKPEEGAEEEFWKKSRKRRLAVTYHRKQKVQENDERHHDLKTFTETEPETHQRIQIDLCTQSKPLTALDLLQDEDLPETGAEIHQDPPEETGPETGSGFERPQSGNTKKKKKKRLGKRLLSCPQCGGGFIEEQDLLVHMRIHIKEHLFSCSLCGQRFATRDSLTAHMSTHAVGEPFCCSLCDPRFPHSQSECEHMKEVTEQTRFHCSCGEEFTWRRHLIRHMEGHRPESRHHRCSPETRNQDSAEPESTDKEESGFNSRTLDSDVGHVLHPESDNHRLLEIHKHDHQEAPQVIKEEQEEVWIGTSKLTFTPVAVKSEDEEEKPVTVDAPFSKTSIWNDNAAEAKSDDSVDSDFWKEGEAQRKMNSLKKDDYPKSSKGNKIYICFKCGERFHVLGDLRCHEKRIHRIKEKKKRTFPCSVCGHVCPYLSNLKIHMRRHTGEKPFVCQKCGKKYAQKENLRLHLLKHARESPSDIEST